MSNETTTVQSEKEMKGNTVVSFTKPTPMWATWVFRIVFFATTAATFIIAGDGSIPDELKVRIILYMKGFDLFVWGCAKGIGVDKKTFQNEEL